jgi:hypothetical protein
MTMFSAARLGARDWHIRGHMTAVLLAGAMAAIAIVLVVYLLWPTWSATGSNSTPERLPISVGGALFNVPTGAVRMKIQRHSGLQERVDLAFDYPSLKPPDAPRHVTAETAGEADQPIERILFLSVAAHHDALGPDARLSTIYPRYLDQAPASVADGMTMRAFRDGTPYAGEDLFLADSPNLVARCTRDAATPGMCLNERRIDGADLVFRFPRSWLIQWREVANALERLTAQLHGTRG